MSHAAQAVRRALQRSAVFFSKRTIRHVRSIMTEKRMSTSPGAPRSTTQVKSLYDRLGGLDAINAAVDSWVARVAGDDRVNQKFVRTDIPRLKKEVVDLLCKTTGGPCTYTGRNTRKRYDGMKVTAAEFDAVMQHLGETLDELNVRNAEQHELVGLLMPMRPEIVEVESQQTGTPLPDSYEVAPPLS
jgi:hemoglobin